MLPLWRKRIYIAISPEHISMVLLGRGLKPKLLACFDEAIQPQDGDKVPWQAVVGKLAQILTHSEWQNADAEIVLSNKLARYAMIPPNVKLKKYAGREAFARHVMSQTYGGIVNQWVLRIQHQNPSAPWLVSAIDQDLLQNLQLICINSKLKLGGVTPWLVPVFNRLRKQSIADPSWLVLNESGVSLCVLINNGEIISVNETYHDNINDLPLILDRENLLSPLAEPCKIVYLHAPFGTNLPALKSVEYEINMLEIPVLQGLPNNADAYYAMAFSGLM